MSIQANLPIVVQQLPAIQQLAHAEIMSAANQHAIYSPYVQKQIHEMRKQIQDVERPEPSVKMRDEKREEEPREPSGRKSRERPEEGHPLETNSYSSSEVSGNLVNLRA